jgi:hypothetical protein
MAQDCLRACEGTTRSLAALSGGLFFVRDVSQLKCMDLRPRKP